MFHKATVFGAVLAALSFTAIGCGGPAADLEAGEVDDSYDTKGDAAGRIRTGSYQVTIPGFFAMDLTAAGAYTLQGGCSPVPGGGEAICHAIILNQGSYLLTKSGSKRFLKLINSAGKTEHKFQYTVSGMNSEHVTLVEGDKTSTAELKEADKSQDGESCGGFVFHPLQCASNLVCINTKHIPDVPGTCQPPAVQN
jgi:hypothetical protein